MLQGEQTQLDDRIGLVQDRALIAADHASFYPVGDG